MFLYEDSNGQKVPAARTVSLNVGLYSFSPSDAPRFISPLTNPFNRCVATLDGNPLFHPIGWQSNVYHLPPSKKSIFSHIIKIIITIYQFI